MPLSQSSPRPVGLWGSVSVRAEMKSIPIIEKRAKAIYMRWTGGGGGVGGPLTFVLNSGSVGNFLQFW